MCVCVCVCVCVCSVKCHYVDKCLTCFHLSVLDGSLPAGRIRRIGRGNLEIRNVDRQDAGLYRCSLADALDVFAEAMLSVHGR